VCFVTSWFNSFKFERSINMKPRMNAASLAPDGYKALLSVERYLAGSSIDHRLLHVIKLRASQINGCAYCIDMHWKDARAAGESDERLYMLDAWEESPLYNDRERAALRWTEALTKITDGHASDEVYESVKPHFNEREMADLTLAISMINAWNRLAISSRSTPGLYKSAQAH
jgi:AhpD family alkylhydroperoxidase